MDKTPFEGQNICPVCLSQKFIYIQSHYQCEQCHYVLSPCCEGASCE